MKIIFFYLNFYFFNKNKILRILNNNNIYFILNKKLFINFNNFLIKIEKFYFKLISFPLNLE